jgi:metal-responsive CopG/Arc/MetJ family transcriptional regulator
MGSISLKMPDDLLRKSADCAEAVRLSRAEYIRRAIDRMNRETESRLRAERMAKASRKVRKESMKINAEFSAVEDNPCA